MILFNPLQTEFLLNEGFRKHAVEIGSGAMIYIPSFIKIGSAIQKLIEGIRSHTENMVV
jgi:hypothetical protein